MSVAWNTPVTFAQWQTLVDQANAKLPLPNSRFTYTRQFAWPPLFVVQNATQMVELYQADWGERPGGIAVLRDGLAARRLTGTDRKDAAAWTTHPSMRVALDSTTLLGAAAPAGTPGVVIQGTSAGLYLATGTVWSRQTNLPAILPAIGRVHGVNLDTRRTIRRALGPSNTAPLGRYAIVNGEYFAFKNLPHGTLGFQASRFPFSASQTPVHNVVPLVGALFRDLDFYTTSPAPIVDLTGTLLVDRSYDSPNATTRKIGLRIDGHPMQANGLGFSLAVTAVGSVPVAVTGPAGVSVDYLDQGGTVGFARVFFNNADLAGEIDIEVTLPSGGTFRDTEGILSGALVLTRRFEGASPVSDTEAISATATHKLEVDHESIAPRWFVKARTAFNPLGASSGLTVPLGWPATCWLEAGAPQYVPATPGFFLARPWLPNHVNCDPIVFDFPSSTFVSLMAKRPRTTTTWTAGGGPRSARGAEFLLPRVFFRRTTDSPNSVPLEQFAQPGSQRVTPGCMIYEVHVRRKATQGGGGLTPYLPAHWAEIPFLLGYMRGGAFMLLDGGEASIPANQWSITLKTEWLNMDSISLAYEALESLDIQARLLDLDSSPDGDYGSLGATIFEHFNTLEAALASI